MEELRLKDFKAKNYLFSSIDKTVFKTITKKGTTKEIWESMKTKFQGSAMVKRAQLQALRREFEVLETKEGETINHYFDRVMIVSNSMRNCGEVVEEVKIVEKILMTLTYKFNYVVWSIEESKDLNELTVDELQSSLLVHEQKLVRKTVTNDQALRVGVDYGRGRNRGCGNYQGRGRRHNSSRSKETFECFHCHKFGHYRNECLEWSHQTHYRSEFSEEMLLMATENGEQHEALWLCLKK